VAEAKNACSTATSGDDVASRPEYCRSTGIRKTPPPAGYLSAGNELRSRAARDTRHDQTVEDR
jgi:hypothetical protein